MSRKTTRPTFPDSYQGKNADEYNQSRWMERNQKRTTLLTIQYLYDQHLDTIRYNDVLRDIPYLVLDLGCGTGFSSEILAENGFRVIGVDILKDMISKAGQRKKNYDRRLDIEYILSDINNLPLRTKSIDHIISISAYNFITHPITILKEKEIILFQTARDLNEILKNHGRFVLEFYPIDEKELNLFKSSFINNGFNGFMIKKHPNQNSGQTFLLLKKVKN
ncbi:MAG: methyltransferase domain-containing protein [Candidatus Lokiarchaeota archaeon]|jgi:SAM-dependent methyltransferase